MAKDKSVGSATASHSEPKKPKQRSPNYPVCNLKKAVELAKALSDKYGSHQIPVPLVHKLWNFEEGSNAGNRHIAALESYGLIDEIGEGQNRKVALSKNGSRVVGNAPDRSELLRQGALGPKIHKEILKHYGDAGIPSDDELLERYLVWDRPEGQRFNPDFVKGFIKRFRETLEYSGLAPNGSNEKNGGTPPAPTVIKVGDYVQWTSQGAGQFADPRRVVGIADGGEYAFVEGSETGLPMSELSVVDPPAETGNSSPPIPTPLRGQPPANPFFKPQAPSIPEGPRIEFPLPNDNSIEIRLKKPVSKEDFERIKKLVELSEASLVSG